MHHVLSKENYFMYFQGRNFLHTAILKDDLEAVLFLLSVNANVHSKTQDTNKLSPLLLAVSKGNEMIVR